MDWARHTRGIAGWRNLVKTGLILLVAVGAWGQAVAGTRDVDRPNILFITTDQQFADVMSCAGSPWLKTPAMDSLAQNGVRFTRAYVNYPVCKPERYAMYTGRLPCTRKQADINDKPTISLGNQARRGGYRTAYFGKWHIQDQTFSSEDHAHHGFDVHTGGQDETMTDNAIKYLSRKEDQPFFVVVSYYNPHDICEWGRKKAGRTDRIHMRNGDVDVNPALSECPPLPENFAINPDEAEAVVKRRSGTKKGKPNPQKMAMDFSDDDFAWENDKIAFRAYGPALKESGEDSGFDAWLKRVDYPIVNKWYKENAEGNSYHEDHGEGYDPYKVGSSRGCGGLALWIDGKMVRSNVFTDWKVISNGPELSVFVLTYEWNHGSDVYREEKEIRVRLGDRLFKSSSTFWRNGEIAAGLPIAIGLVRHHQTDSVSKDLSKGWMSIWESIDESGLGTGVVIDPKRIDDFQLLETGKKLEDHALIITKCDAKGQLVYGAGYGWERAGEIKTANDWNAYLAECETPHQP